jgi:hypothetical protein
MTALFDWRCFGVDFGDLKMTIQLCTYIFYRKCIAYFGSMFWPSKHII